MSRRTHLNALDALSNQSIEFRGALLHAPVAVITLLQICLVLLRGDDLSLFDWHPTLMILAFSGCMSMGVTAYRSVAVGKEILKTSRRRHRALQVLTTGYALAGYIAILLNKAKHNKTVIPTSLHAWIGTITMLALIIQAFFGWLKHLAIKDDAPVVHYKWHGLLGRAVYIFGSISIVWALRKCLTQWARYSAERSRCLVLLIMHVSFDEAISIGE